MNAVDVKQSRHAFLLKRRLAVQIRPKKGQKMQDVSGPFTRAILKRDFLSLFRTYLLPYRYLHTSLIALFFGNAFDSNLEFKRAKNKHYEIVQQNRNV